VTERERDADVGRREPVREVGRCASAQVDHRRYEQHQVDDGDGSEEDGARPAATQQIARGQPGGEEHPEADLGGDDDGEEHPPVLAQAC
jgi:hypothetical protein